VQSQDEQEDKKVTHATSQKAFEEWEMRDILEVCLNPPMSEDGSERLYNDIAKNVGYIEKNADYYGKSAKDVEREILNVYKDKINELSYQYHTTIVSYKSDINPLYIKFYEILRNPGLTIKDLRGIEELMKEDNCVDTLFEYIKSSNSLRKDSATMGNYAVLIPPIWMLQDTKSMKSALLDEAKKVDDSSFNLGTLHQDAIRNYFRVMEGA
jgi:hypothetical protein